MSDMTESILNAAEQRIRSAGFNGFSFREIAADVGVKSASVHYHFPTKGTLSACVARRYRQRFIASVEAEIENGCPVIEAWKQGFRRALLTDEKMCLCGVLGATINDLPDEVMAEARQFFEDSLKILGNRGLSQTRAMQVMATLEGAMLLANVLALPSAFDEATASLT
jgi:TetR/AcrR family transcriptional repressor of nem operon